MPTAFQNGTRYRTCSVVQSRSNNVQQECILPIHQQQHEEQDIFPKSQEIGLFEVTMSASWTGLVTRRVAVEDDVWATAVEAVTTGLSWTAPFPAFHIQR